MSESATCAGCGAPLPGAAAQPPLANGTLLHDGVYSVGRVLARSALAITYEGMDLVQRRFVAIREFFPVGCARQGRACIPGGAWSAAGLAEARRAFVAQARALARITDQPGLPHVYGTFEENQGFFLITEPLAGKSLASVLKQKGGKLVEAEAVACIASLGEALNATHRAGLLHLDLDVAGITLVETGPGKPPRPVLEGWGDNPPPSARTVPEGTAPYTAPEVWASVPCTPATDVYSLAAILYHMLGGVRPPDARERARGKPLPDLRQVNPWVSARVAGAVGQALSMAPDRRPAGMREFVDALRFGAPSVTMAGGAPRAAAPAPSTSLALARRQGAPPARRTAGAAEPPTPSEMAGPERPRGRGRVVLLAAVVFLAGLGGLLTLLIGIQPPAPQPYSVPGRSTPARATTGRSPVAVAPAPPPEAPTDVTSPGPVADAASPTVAPLPAGTSGPPVPWALVLKGHEGVVLALAWSPDGKLLLSGSADRTARLWDLATGKEIRPFPHGGAVRGVAFSPDGTRLATSCADGTIRIMSLQGQVLTRIQTGGEPCNVAFSPDGRLVLGRGPTSLVCAWSTETGAVTRSLKRPGQVSLLGFSQGGARAVSVDVAPATAGGPLTIQVGDLATGELKTTIRYAEPGLGARRPFDLPYACLSADGRLALTHGPSPREEDELDIWDLGTGRLVSRHHILYLGDPLAVSPQGQTAILTVEMHAALWDLAEGREIRRYGEDATVLQCAAFSPDDRTFAAGGHDHAIYVGTLR